MDFGNFLKQRLKNLQDFGGGVVNMTGVPSLIDAGRLGVANLTGDRKASDAATIRLANNLPQFLPVALTESVIPFAQSVVNAGMSPYIDHVANQQADYARRILGNNTGNPAHDAAVESYANSLKTRFYNDQLNRAGLTLGDSTGDVARTIGGQAGNAALGIGSGLLMSGYQPSALLGDLKGAAPAAAGARTIAAPELASTAPTFEDLAASSEAKLAQLKKVMQQSNNLDRRLSRESNLYKQAQIQIPGNPGENPMGNMVTNRQAFLKALTHKASVPESQLNAATHSALRPSDALQTQLETAWNNNSLGVAQRIINRMPADLRKAMQSLQDMKVQRAQGGNPQLNRALLRRM